MTIHPTNPKGGNAFAAYQAKSLIEKIDPALVFILRPRLFRPTAPAPKSGAGARR
jgi:hypothetical protein